MQYDDFRTAIEDRLRQRGDMFAGAYFLDLRSAKFALGRVVVRQPGAPKWEAHGRTTTDEDTARTWVADERFCKPLWARYLARRGAPTSAGLSTRAAAQRYLDSFVERRVDPDGVAREVVPEHLRSRVSMVRCHIVPALGHIALDALTRPIVRAAMESLTVTRSNTPGGPRTKHAAAHGTKLQFRRALAAIWQHTFPDTAAPFSGIRLARPKAAGDDRVTRAAQLALRGPRARATNGALDMPQLKAALVAAMQYDMDMGGRKNLKRTFVPATACTIAIHAALGLRVSELRTLMWGHIHEDEGYVQILNAKVEQLGGQESRPVPLQQSLIPWLQELRASRGNPARDEFVVRTVEEDANARCTPMSAATGTRHRPAPRNTLIARYAKVLRRAGLKVQGKASHGLRATFFSLMSASGTVPAQLLKGYLGHAVIFGGSSDEYFASLVSAIKPSHRRAIKLPSPNEVRQAAASFTPAADWKTPKKKENRSKAGKAAARARRLARQPLGVSLSSPAPDEST